MNRTPHIIHGTCHTYKKVSVQGKEKFIATFAIENDDWVGGLEYITKWLSREPKINEQWRIFRNGFELTPFEPVERS